MQSLTNINIYLNYDKNEVNENEYIKIVRFLNKEAELLEYRKYLEWLDFLHPDVEYIVLVREIKDKKDNSISNGLLIYDKKDTIKIKIDRLTSNYAWSDNPPSVSKYMITNILAYNFMDYYLARSNVLFIKYRSSDLMYLTYKRADIISKDMKILKRIVLPDVHSINMQDLTYFL
ncbi:aromatic-ring-hydroxylating dioxygenase subunit beta [Acidianus manzaensis]|nr:aromatic-ring-hydroxylating dioxygenase subunit beta [Acidianus manzaensis]